MGQLPTIFLLRPILIHLGCSYYLLILLGTLTGYSQSVDTLQLAQRILPNANIETYKKVGNTNLRLSIIYPPNYQTGQTYSAIVFFFGGGWRTGSVKQFEQQCRYFASRGMIAITADYRVETRQGTTPVEAVQDAKSAMRWLRKQASRLGIQADHIVAAGGSAGGHLALATATIPKINEPGEDTLISTKPGALLLFNPVVKTTLGGYGYEWLGDRADSLSPLSHVQSDIPPTLIFHGTEDTTVPITNVEEFCQRMQSQANVCQLYRFPGKKHGFFNYSATNRVVYDQIIALADDFLVQLGYLKPLIAPTQK